MKKRDTSNTCVVVLAAGASLRFGGDKLLVPLPGGEALIDRALRACAALPHLVVASPKVAWAIGARSRLVVNERPECGMNHSLKLAHAAIEADAWLAVLPADLAFIEAENVDFVADAAASDVTYPQSPGGVPGHPVVFSPRARSLIERLPDGDSIRSVRDAPELSRRVLTVEAPWPYRDVDRESDLRDLAAERRTGDDTPQSLPRRRKRPFPPP